MIQRLRWFPVLILIGLSAFAAPQTASERLHDVFAREWQARLREYPLFATAVGVHDYDDRLPSMRPEDLERRDGLWRGFLAELDTIDAAALDHDDRINLRIFKDQLEDRVAGYRFGAYQIPLNADSGFQTAFARLPDEMPLKTVKDYRNYISRMEAFPRYVDEEIALMRMGLERGMSLPRVVLDGIEVTMETQIVDDPTASRFYAPFGSFPFTVPETEREGLRDAGRAAILIGVVPGYRALLEFMVGEYIPNTRTTLGASELPDGREYYAQRIRHFTTLDLTAEEVHRIGLREVDRIQREMDAVIEEVGFKGSFAEFLEFLRTDPRFYATTPEQLLKEAAWIANRMNGKLPALFKTLPRLPYTVEPVPDYLAPKYTAGRYVDAPFGSTQPGRYWVNTYALDTRPLYNLEALTLHEAVPGHHLQIALNQELADLPDFRRHSYLSAFGEGWGLYSEWLGLEAGFYTDPYRNFGRLTYEMWRACRLVVDTGVHAMGWSREQMLEYLGERTALSRHEIETETDRYISWPGQALAYKIGQIRILGLRRKAEAALGTRFDVREFHDAVLLNGSVPLPVLEDEIDRFIADRLAGDGSSGPAGAADVVIDTASGDPGELATATAIRALIDKYDLGAWMFTRKILIDRNVGIPHSHPVLTLDTGWGGNEINLLSGLLHEQIHWFVLRDQAALAAAIKEMRERYPDAPGGPPEGARNLDSTYLHLVVCSLEYSALESRIGRDAAEKNLLAKPYYTWVFHTVVEDRDALRPILERHGLVMP